MEIDEKKSEGMDKKVPTALALTILLLVAILAGVLFWSASQLLTESSQKKQGKKPTGRECTAEAKICPDGSSVGRTGPNCEFSPCPEGKSLVGDDRDEHGCIPSAGYSWCEEKEKCLRIWEEDCENATFQKCKNTDFQITSLKNTSDWKVMKSKYGIEMKVPRDWVEFSPYDGESFELKTSSLDDYVIMGDKNKKSNLAVDDYTFENANNEVSSDWIDWFIKFTNLNVNSENGCSNIKCGTVDCVEIVSLAGKNSGDNNLYYYIIRMKNNAGIKVLSTTQRTEMIDAVLSSVKLLNQ